MASLRAELFVDDKTDLAEGPFWDRRSQVLGWVDIELRVVHFINPDTHQRRSIQLPSSVGAVAPRLAGGWVAALADGFWMLSESGGCESITSVATLDRFNDGKCDPWGRFWAGTKSRIANTHSGSLYRLDPSGVVNEVLSNVGISNGLDWSPDADVMYYVDTPTRRIDAFDFDGRTGQVSRRRPFVDLATANGLPDGLTVDAEGYVWVAMWGGWSVLCYDAVGRLARSVSLPVSQVSSVAFGGPDLQDLFITSARTGLSAAQLRLEPRAGGLFWCRPGGVGRPANVFGG